MSLAEGLTRALVRAGVPVVGVSISDPLNRSTWVITYGSEVTPANMVTGEALRASYSLETDTDLINEEAIARFDSEKMVKALGIATANRLGVSLATFKAEVIAAYKALP